MSRTPLAAAGGCTGRSGCHAHRAAAWSVRADPHGHGSEPRPCKIYVHDRRDGCQVRRSGSFRQSRRRPFGQWHPGARASKYGAIGPTVRDRRSVVVPGADGKRHSGAARRHRYRLRSPELAPGAQHYGERFGREDHGRLTQRCKSSQGAKVNIEGSQVVNGVLIATRVSFE